MKKILKLFSLCIIISAITLVMSCGKKDKVEQTQDILQGRITLLTDAKYESALKFVAENFKKVHPKVEVVIKSQNNFYGNLGQILKDKNSPVDIVNMENMYIQTSIYTNSDSFDDITSDVSSYKDRILKNKIDNVYDKNKIYGVPWASSPKIMVYRKDIFAKEGINPDDIKTWSDFIEVGKKISKDTGKKIMPNIINDYSDIKMILANQLGTSFVNKEGKVDFLSKEWIRTASQIKDLYADGTLLDVELEDSVVQLAAKDKIVSFIADPQLIVNFTSRVKEENGKWGVIKLPAFESGGNRDVSVGGSSFVINKNSEKKHIAKEFIKYAITDERTAIDCMHKYGIFPSFMDIYNLKEFDNVDSYFGERVWYMFSDVDRGAYTMNYTKRFPLLRDVSKNALCGGKLKDKDMNLVLDFLQKESIKKISEAK